MERPRKGARAEAIPKATGRIRRQVSTIQREAVRDDEDDERVSAAPSVPSSSLAPAILGAASGGCPFARPSSDLSQHFWCNHNKRPGVGEPAGSGSSPTIITQDGSYNALACWHHISVQWVKYKNSEPQQSARFDLQPRVSENRCEISYVLKLCP